MFSGAVACGRHWSRRRIGDAIDGVGIARGTTRFVHHFMRDEGVHPSEFVASSHLSTVMAGRAALSNEGGKFYSISLV
jgi:hypothetical protein